MKNQYPAKVIFFVFLLIFSACSKDNKTQSKKEIKEIVEHSKINFNVYGDGDTTLVFVHGWCINQTYWENQVEEFSGRFKVITLDLGGHGKSKVSRTDWSVENYKKDVLEVINQLGLSKIVLIGHSMSGDIILSTTLDIPEKIIGFVGVDNFKEVEFELNDTIQAEFDGFMQMMEADFEGVAENYVAGFLFPENADSLCKLREVNDIKASNKMMAINTFKNLIPFYGKEKVMLQELPVKLNLIVSDMSPTDEIALENYCPKGFGIYAISGVGHYPMIEKPEEFNSTLTKVLNEL